MKMEKLHQENLLPGHGEAQYSEGVKYISFIQYLKSIHQKIFNESLFCLIQISNFQ